MTTSQAGLYQAYKRAKDAIYNANYSTYVTSMSPQAAHEAASAAVENAVLSQSYLRLEQILTANVSVVNFPIIVNNNNSARITERRLAQQDAFFVSSMAFYIALASSATDATFIPQTFPSPKVFTNGGAGFAAGQAPYYSIYNGSLSFTVNKSIITPNLAMLDWLQVPQTQLPATPAGVTNQFDPSQISILEPNINFIGTKDNKITLDMNVNIATGNLDANTVLIIVLKGVLAQNVTLMS